MFTLAFIHPGYVGPYCDDSSPKLAALKAQTAAAVFKKGVALRGTVLDEANQPVAGAKLSLGYAWMEGSPNTASDGDGRFEFAHVSPVQQLVLAQASGFA